MPRLRLVVSKPRPRLRKARPIKEPRKLLRPCDIIQAALLARNVSRKELATATGMTRSMTDAVVSGRRTIDGDQKPLIEKALGIPAGRLRELERALMKQAQELYSDVLRRAREDTYHLLPRSWRHGPDLKVVATKE